MQPFHLNQDPFDRPASAPPQQPHPNEGPTAAQNPPPPLTQSDMVQWLMMSGRLMESFNSNLAGLNDTLRNQHVFQNQLLSQVGMTARSASPKMRIPDVPTFHGDKAKSDDFLVLLKNFFVGIEIGGPKLSDKEKITYTINRLRDAGFDWISPYLQRVPEPEFCSNFEMFVDEFRAFFGDISSVQKSKEKMLKCRQGSRSVEAYWNEFHHLWLKSGFTETDGAAIFFFGLSDRIRSAIAHQPMPTSFSPFVQNIRFIDLNHRENMSRNVWNAPHDSGNPPSSDA